MKRSFFIAAIIILGVAALSLVAALHHKWGTRNANQSAALFNAHPNAPTGSLEEQSEHDGAALLLDTTTRTKIDASSLSPTSTDVTRPSERVARGMPSATSAKSLRVPVVVYHTLRPKSANKDNPYNVQPITLEKELRYLEDNGYTTITYADVIAMRKGDMKAPEKPIILTFDDGIIDHYTVALPALKRHKMKAVFYIYPNPINHKNKKWMTWDQVKELHAAGMEIGSHTYTHPYLNKIVALTWDEQKPLLNKEIALSKTVIEEKLGNKVLSIAYPFGLYNARIIASVDAAGYEFGRTIWPGTWQDPSHDLEWSSQILTDNFNLFKNYLEKN
jgi:peptidoglycan/xylan/chitin deacetylase (PgdA/CDA1 family)